MPVVHATGIALGVSAAAAVGEIVVRTPGELTAALKQRERVIVVNDAKLAARLLRLQWAREVRLWYFGTLLALLTAYSISQRIGVELSLLNDWKAGKINGQVRLTPAKRPND